MATMMSRLSTRGLASASARHPWRTVLVWVGIIAVAIGLNAALLEDGLTTEFAFSNDRSPPGGRGCWRTASAARVRSTRSSSCARTS